MKLRKRIGALGAAMVMAVSMMNIGASAYELRYFTNAPTSVQKRTDEELINGVYGTVTKIYFHSDTFTTLLPGASVKATNMNMSNKPYATIKQANKQYTITVNMYLTGACIHNFYEVKNGAASISVTASGTSSHN